MFATQLYRRINDDRRKPLARYGAFEGRASQAACSFATPPVGTRPTLGFKIVNLDALQANGKGLMAEPPWTEGADVLDPNGGPWRIPNFLETPRIVYDVKFKRAPRDSEGGDNAWIVSAKLKAIVERLAPRGSVFRACETFWSNGEPGPERWLCAIVQVFSGVVDDDLSENLTPCVFPNGQSAYLITPLSKVILLQSFYAILTYSA